jgi:hypothetical protein
VVVGVIMMIEIIAINYEAEESDDDDYMNQVMSSDS